MGIITNKCCKYNKDDEEDGTTGINEKLSKLSKNFL